MRGVNRLDVLLAQQDLSFPTPATCRPSTFLLEELLTFSGKERVEIARSLQKRIEASLAVINRYKDNTSVPWKAIRLTEFLILVLVGLLERSRVEGTLDLLKPSVEAVLSLLMEQSHDEFHRILLSLAMAYYGSHANHVDFSGLLGKYLKRLQESMKPQPVLSEAKRMKLHGMYLHILSYVSLRVIESSEKMLGDQMNGLVQLALDSLDGKSIQSKIDSQELSCGLYDPFTIEFDLTNVTREKVTDEAIELLSVLGRSLSSKPFDGFVSYVVCYYHLTFWERSVVAKWVFRHLYGVCGHPKQLLLQLVVHLSNVLTNELAARCLQSKPSSSSSSANAAKLLSLNVSHSVGVILDILSSLLDSPPVAATAAAVKAAEGTYHTILYYMGHILWTLVSWKVFHINREGLEAAHMLVDEPRYQQQLEQLNRGIVSGYGSGSVSSNAKEIFFTSQFSYSSQQGEASSEEWTLYGPLNDVIERLLSLYPSLATDLAVQFPGGDRRLAMSALFQLYLEKSQHILQSYPPQSIQSTLFVAAKAVVYSYLSSIWNQLWPILSPPHTVTAPPAAVTNAAATPVYRPAMAVRHSVIRSQLLIEFLFAMRSHHLYNQQQTVFSLIQIIRKLSPSGSISGLGTSGDQSSRRQSFLSARLSPLRRLSSSPPPAAMAAVHQEPLTAETLERRTGMPYSHLLLLIDAIFNTLCTEYSVDQELITASLFQLHVALFECCGLLYIVESLPVVLGLFEFWVLCLPKAANNSSLVAMCSCQTWYFAAYFTFLSKRYDGTALLRAINGKSSAWRSTNQLHSLLRIDPDTGDLIEVVRSAGYTAKAIEDFDDMSDLAAEKDSLLEGCLKIKEFEAIAPQLREGFAKQYEPEIDPKKRFAELTAHRRGSINLRTPYSETGLDDNSHLVATDLHARFLQTV